MKIVNQEDNHCLIITEEFGLFKLCLVECVNGELIIIKEIEDLKNGKNIVNFVQRLFKIDKKGDL